MGKGFLPSATRIFGKQNLECRIEDKDRHPIATIDANGIIYDAQRKKLGSIDAAFIVYDSRNVAIGRITPEKEFLDERHQIKAKLLADWHLVGPDEKLIAVVQNGRILGYDHQDKLIFTVGCDPRRVLAWFLYFGDLNILKPDPPNVL
jgi:hypothetical protein